MDAMKIKSRQINTRVNCCSSGKKHSKNFEITHSLLLVVFASEAWV
jgi:hypothetical protein